MKPSISHLNKSIFKKFIDGRVKIVLRYAQSKSKNKYFEMTVFLWTGKFIQNDIYKNLRLFNFGVILKNIYRFNSISEYPNIYNILW